MENLGLGYSDEQREKMDRQPFNGIYFLDSDLKEIARLILLQVDHNRDVGKDDCFTIDEIVDIINRRILNDFLK